MSRVVDYEIARRLGYTEHIFANGKHIYINPRAWNEQKNADVMEKCGVCVFKAGDKFYPYNPNSVEGSYPGFVIRDGVKLCDWEWNNFYNFAQFYGILDFSRVYGDETFDNKRIEMTTVTTLKLPMNGTALCQQILPNVIGSCWVGDWYYHSKTFERIIDKPVNYHNYGGDNLIFELGNEDAVRRVAIANKKTLQSLQYRDDYVGEMFRKGYIV